MSILQTIDLKKYYGTEPNITRALNGVNFTVEQGEFVAVVGTSGSGKSTLLHMMGGLDTPTSGSVIVRGEELAKKNDDELTIFRRRNIGFIERTFQSVLIQTYRPLEYVLVDGGSTDGTIELIKRYLPIFEENGIDVIYKSEPDKGISDAFNKGIDRASGSIIGITNSDDCIAEGALEKIAAKFKMDTDVVCGNCLWNDSENGISYIRKSRIKDIHKIIYEMVLMHPTCYVRKSTYEKNGVFDTELKCVMDKDLMARFYKNNARFDYVDDIISIMSSGGVSDVDVKRVYKEGVLVAMRNGVPRWFAEIRWRVMAVKASVVRIIKKNRIMWSFLCKKK